MDSPIFIVGANRSGTTLLRLILNAHPRIAIPDELIYLDSYLAGVPIEQWRSPSLSPSRYEAFVDHFLAESCTSMPELDTTALKDDILDGPINFRHPYKCALTTWARHHDKPRWGEKTPGNLFYADILLDMFPQAQFLYMVRDPRAGVASMEDVSFFPNDTTFNALSRRKHDTEGRALLEQHVPASQRMTLRYEDLVRHPEARTQDICSFLDEPFTPRMLQFHRDADDYMKDDAEEDYNAAATQPITDDRVDTWKNQLSRTEIATIEYVCSELFDAFDYSRTNQPLALSTRAKILLKWGYWMLECWRHREIRHYTVKYRMFERSRTRLAALLEDVQSQLSSAAPS